MRSHEGASEPVIVGSRPRASGTGAWVIGMGLLLACASRQAAPIAVAAPTPVQPVVTPSPVSTPVAPADRPSSSASDLHVIVPSGGEARVHDLVLTALEVREEQYDHEPGHGDVLVATLHVRAVGSQALSAADMAAQRPALVTVRSDQAEGSRWRQFRFVVTGGDRMAVVLTVTPIASAAALTGTPLKLAADQGTGSAAGLAVTVLGVVEKRTMEGNSMMIVSLHLRRAGTPAPTDAVMREQAESLVTLTSDPGDDVATWNGFRVGYLGGWRTEVELQIVPPEGAADR